MLIAFTEPTSTHLVSLLVGTGVLSLFSLYRAAVEGKLISASSGLHFNCLFMLSLGPLCYLYGPHPIERFSFSDTIAFLPEVAGPFLAGYAVWVLLDWYRTRRYVTVPLEVPPLRAGVLLCFALISLVGYVGSQYKFATSGLGTILIVMKNWMYPTLLLVLLNAKANLSSLALSVVWLGCVMGLSLISAWRSDFVMSGVCILNAIILRRPLLVAPAIVFGLVVLWVGLPTLQYKKLHVSEFRQSPVEAILASQQVSMDARSAMLLEFAGIRLNYAREMAYIRRGIVRGLIGAEGGRSYVNALYQMVPRYFWPEKPSFNQFSNYKVPRAVGLVGKDDPFTSWGVNAYAEFILNYPPQRLVLFVPLVFGIFSFLERFAVSLMQTPDIALMTRGTLFFLTISLVGLVNLGTYVVWGILCLFIADRFFLNLERLQS